MSHPSTPVLGQLIRRGRIAAFAIPTTAAVIGIAVAAMLAAVIVRSGFDGLYGQDSFFYQAYAMGALREALLRGDLVPPPFTWPPGYPWLVSLGSLVLGTGAAPGLVVSVIAAATVPVTTALLARELDRQSSIDRWMPIAAGLIVAVTPHLWQSGVVVMSDTTGLAFATLGAWALATYAGQGRRGWLLLSAAAIAFAIDVRSVYSLVAIPLGVAGVVVTMRGSARRWVDLGLAAAVGLLVLAPMVGPMVAAAARGDSIPFAISLQSHGWDPANALRSTFDGPDGHFAFDLPMGAFYLLEPARTWYLGPLFAAFALLGVGAVVRRPTTLTVAMLLAWPLLVIGFLSGDTTQNTRFALAALPPIAILAATGVGLLARVIAGRPQWMAALLAVVVLLGLGAQVVGAWRFTDAFVVRQQQWLAAADRLAARIPAGDRLIAFGSTLALRHHGFSALELYDLEPAELLTMLGDGQPTWLILPRDGIDGQWANKPPGRNVSALRAGPGLMTVATDGDWTLHRVGFAAHLS